MERAALSAGEGRWAASVSGSAKIGQVARSFTVGEHNEASTALSSRSLSRQSSLLCWEKSQATKFLSNVVTF